MKRVSKLGAVMIAAAISPLAAATVPVRFVEGMTHGFLVLRDTGGKALAHGDLTQVVRGDETEKRMVFHFNDGSLFDERVTFTQRDVFVLKTYRLTARGPAFPADKEISLTPATGAYHVQTKERDGGKEKSYEGHLELPEDLYNGLIITIVKDLPKGAACTVHYLAFAPDPKLIELELTPAGEQRVAVGDLDPMAVRYLLKPRLGIWLKMGATILGRVPPVSQAWITSDDVPAFVGFEGTLMTPGPTWRIETVSPNLARGPESPR